MENAAAFAASGAPMAISPVAYLGQVRILAVEEDPVCLANLTQMLQRHGYQVTAKASSEEGLRALQENPEGFDLVMTAVRTQGPGIDGFELLKHAAQRYPVILFSGVEPMETMMRGLLGGACAFLAKPLGEELVRDVWQHVVVRRRLNAASGAGAAADAPGSDVVVRQDGTGTKRGSAGLDDPDKGGSDGSRNEGRATKKTKFNSSPDLELHAAFVRAAEQLRGTEDYCPRGIQDLLEVQGVQVTIEQVTSHLEIYRRDCLTNHLSAMTMASSSHSNMSKNYSTPGISGFYMRPQGATNINQTRLLSNGASQVGFGILGNESYRASHVGLLYNNGNRHGSTNGNSSDKYGNGYDYQYGNGNFNDNANAIGCHNGNSRSGVLLNGSMVGTSLPSNLAQVQQAMPTNSSIPSSMILSMDNPNTMGQQECPRISQLRYHGGSGGISMSPWPMDDGEELLMSYMQAQGDNEVMQHTASTGMAQRIHGDGAAGQISASQPQDLTDPLSSESSNGNGTGAGTSGGSGVGTDGNVNCELSADEMEMFFSEQEIH